MYLGRESRLRGDLIGKPKFSKKKYDTPSHPWQEYRIKEENELIKKYGLKNKKEIWKAETTLRRYRSQARELLAKIGGGNPQVKKESEQLLMHLTRMNILTVNSTLDDVLALETEPILSRRLQTLTYLKGLANTPLQARQIISHGHIAIDGRRITVPSYVVTKDEEDKIGYFTDSPLNDELHPARPSSEFKSVPLKKEIKTEDSKGKKLAGITEKYKTSDEGDGSVPDISKDKKEIDKSKKVESSNEILEGKSEEKNKVTDVISDENKIKNIQKENKKDIESDKKIETTKKTKDENIKQEPEKEKNEEKKKNDLEGGK